VSNHLFGADPASGKVKTLSVVFSSNGVQYQNDIREGEALSLTTPRPEQTNIAAQTQATQTEPAAASATPVVAATAGLPEKLSSGTALWLLQRRSVTTKTGVIGILPGSKVTVTKDNGPTVTVSDGTHTFEAERTQLTVDPAVAEQAATADYASQVSLSAAREESERKLSDEKNRYWTKEQSNLDQRETIRTLESRYRALQEQESELVRQIREASQKVTTIRGGHIRNPASSDVPSLEASLRDVRSAKDGIKRQIEQVQKSYQKQQ
jgi:hypothetical protein